MNIIHSIDPSSITSSTPNGDSKGFCILAPPLRIILLPGYGCRKPKFIVKPSIIKVAPLSKRQHINTLICRICADLQNLSPVGSDWFCVLFLDDSFAFLLQDLSLDFHRGEGFHVAVEDGLHAVHRHAAELAAAGVEPRAFLVHGHLVVIECTRANSEFCSFFNYQCTSFTSSR